MADAVALAAFGYRYIPGPFQYSGGVAALPGHQIEHIRFLEPVPLEEGFTRIKRYLSELGLKPTALCACELRSPAPFTEEGFQAFNRVYVGTLERWGIMQGDDNPVARSNVCPAIRPPATPSFHAFSIAVPASSAVKSFVIAGSGEAKEGSGSYASKTVRYRDVSAPAMREKASFVLGELERRMRVLAADWRHTTATQLYTVHDPHPLLAEEIVARGAARHGLIWHLARPPVVDLEYEMDCRAVAIERVLPS
jgi:hypothetical protein